jgi:hypothetical protein
MEIYSLNEFQSSVITCYAARGHHNSEKFVHELGKEYGLMGDLLDVRQEYWRNVPQGDEGMISVKCKPGRGAYAVTVINADMTEKVKASTGQRSDRP